MSKILNFFGYEGSKILRGKKNQNSVPTGFRANLVVSKMALNLSRYLEILVGDRFSMKRELRKKKRRYRPLNFFEKTENDDKS